MHTQQYKDATKGWRFHKVKWQHSFGSAATMIWKLIYSNILAMLCFLRLLCWMLLKDPCRVRLNRSWFMIHYKILNFHHRILSYHDLFQGKIKRPKSIEPSMDVWPLNNMKFILTHCVDYVPFCIDSVHVVHNWPN